MAKKYWWLLVIVCLLGSLAACDQTETVVASEYQRKNDAFIDAVSKSSSYTKLLFLNEKHPIYYRIIKSANPDAPQQKPLQNSRVSVYVQGVLPRLQLLSEKEINILTSAGIKTAIEQGEIFEARSDEAPSTMWLYQRPSNADGTQSSSSIIRGLQIALQHMRKGEVWEVIIPYQLGYGAYNYSVIPGYSTLIFQIELVEILQN